jgi:hypothetical protein
MAKPEYVSSNVDYGHSKKEAVESKIAPFWALKKGFEAKDRRRFPLAMRVREGIHAGNEASDHLNKSKENVRQH